MKKMLVRTAIAGLIGVISISTGAQTQARAQQPPSAGHVATASSVVDAQWEYLVVSYGKTLFGSPEKTLAYRAIGLVGAGQEANEVQRSLDVLGRFGWEVVTIVGTIGGDQQIVFKRKYDKNRSATESAAILKGREVYLKDLLDILERERKVRDEAATAEDAERSKPKLIELDAQDAAQERVRLTVERQAKVDAAIREQPWGGNASARTFADRSYTSVEIAVDVTEEMLKNGNSYRKSEVATWLKGKVLPRLQFVTAGFGGSVYLTATATVKFNGQAVKVDEQKSKYTDFLKRWE